MDRNCYGKNLLVMATALAIEISQGMSADDLNILACFVSVLGDQLALLAATKETELEQSGSGAESKS